MNSANTIALLSSATLCRSPAGLISVKHPSLSVLRFPAKNWYVGVAAMSNNFMKIKRDADKEEHSSNKGVSGKVLITGPKKDVEADFLKFRIVLFTKIIISVLGNALIMVGGVMFMIHGLRSSFAESTVAGAKVLTAVALWVAIAHKIRPRVVRYMKAITEQEIERVKAFYANMNQETMGTMDINELLEALIEEDKANPGRIDVIDQQLVKYLIERHQGLKTNDIGEIEIGQHMRED